MSARVAAALAALTKALTPAQVLVSTEDVAPFQCDALSVFRQNPLAVVFPETEGEIIAVLKICNDFRIPVVPRGAGTGLSGGALPLANGVLLMLTKFNRIIDIDPVARIATVEAGVRNISITEAAESYGLIYAPDPSSQLASTIGGNIAENAGGVHCLKYGLTVQSVLQARGYLMDGTPITLGSVAGDSLGPDLLAAVVGSEGMLMVLVEACVKLIPRPFLARCIIAGFDDVTKAANAVAAVIGAGLIPAGMEMMDQAMTAVADAFVHAGYDLNAAAILLCEADGTPEEVEADIARMTDVLTDGGATSIAVSRDEAERQRFWSGRKNVFGAVGRISPDYYVLDGSIPRQRIGDILHRIRALEGEFGLRCVNAFHAGDGNLHPTILFDAAKPGETARAEAFGEAIMAACVAVGGSITGEHGVGVEKLGAMCGQFTEIEREQFFSLRRAFDPLELLNPGKQVPSHAHCAEFGRMRVRGGQIPFPDLPRF
ncbi:FAD-linked oxidase C-terminal domain-containing protein [Acidiphilium sp.]|uniref:FAD-linked oxidase C-terminal domain-containing protein n=1 Tax=Acidiphilium sp. TaxID=527 RepID=UPI003CFBEC99